MTRAERVRESIEKAIAQGFRFYKSGTGSYEELFNQMRSEGYVVAAWYLNFSKEEQVWEMYIKEKNQKNSAPVVAKPELVPMPVNPKTKEEINERYDEMSVKALKEICKNLKIAGYYKMNKAQMIESLNSAC